MRDIQLMTLKIISDQINMAEHDIPLSADLYNDLGLSNPEMLTLMINIEKSLDIHIPDQEAYEISTVQKLIEKVEKYLTQEKKGYF